MVPLPLFFLCVYVCAPVACLMFLPVRVCAHFEWGTPPPLAWASATAPAPALYVCCMVSSCDVSHVAAVVCAVIVLSPQWVLCVCVCV